MADFKPTKKQADKIMDILNKRNKGKTLLQKPYAFFANTDGEPTSFIQYRNDSRTLFNSQTPTRKVGQKDWRSNTFKPVTRNKTIAIAAQIVSSMIIPRFTAQNQKQQTDRVVSETLRDLYQYSLTYESKDGGKTAGEKFMHAILTAISEGTVHVAEDFVIKFRKLKEFVDSKDGKLFGESEWKEKEIQAFRGCLTSVIPNNEVLIANPWIYDIQDQPWIIREQLMTKGNFDTLFNKFPNSKFVEGGMKTVSISDDGSLYENQQDSDFTIAGDEVSVVYYWSRDTDEYHIVANGVLLTDVNNPIPYAHKMYPITKAVFEPFASNFYWGKSLPHKIAGEQEMINKVYRIILDKFRLSAIPPLVVKGDPINSDVVIPGAITNVDEDTDVAPIAGVTNGVTGNEFAVLKMLEDSVSFSSIGPEGQGVSTPGEKTAQEILTLEENANKLLGLFRLSVTWLVEKQGYLRGMNILEFFSRESIKEIAGEEMQTAFETFEFTDTRLLNGAQGTRIVTVAEPEDTPDARTIRRIERGLKKATGKESEIIFLNPEKIRDLRLWVKVVPEEVGVETSKLTKALQLEKFQIYAQNPLIDQVANTRNLIRANDDDESELLKENPQQEIPPQSRDQSGRPVNGQLNEQLRRASGPPSLNQLVG